MDGRRTTARQYSEYSDFFTTQRERDYDHDTNLPQRESTQIRWGGHDGRREPDSGLGRTQDCRTRWTDDDWVDPDTFTQRTEQPAGRKRRAGGRPAGDQILAEPIIHSDSRWDAPRMRALFTSNGPDSLTSGSDIPEGHTDRPPEIENTEGLCSQTWELEVAVSRLQKELKDCRTDFDIAKKQTTTVTLRPQDIPDRHSRVMWGLPGR